MPDALWFTDDPQACKLLAEDPFALLVGFAIDQQVPVQKAFAGPYVLKQRAGTLDPKKLAEMDLAPYFRREAGDPPLPGLDGRACALISRRSSLRTTAGRVADLDGGEGQRRSEEADQGLPDSAT
jgi:hypothetical protein